MSIRLMTEAWRSDLPTGPKMVLLALCDNANDQGECYPSISMLAEKCSMSERAVFGHIDRLSKMGAVVRKNRAGRSTIYTLDPCRFCTPAESAPLQNLHPTPAESAPPPLQNLHPTPAESAPITVIEPSIEPSLNRQLISAAAEKPQREPAKRAVALPADFEPDAAAAALAQASGLDLAEQLAAFADHHTARGSTFRCWQAALRTWLRNSVRFAAARPVAGAHHARPRAPTFRECDRQAAADRVAEFAPRLADKAAHVPPLTAEELHHVPALEGR